MLILDWERTIREKTKMLAAKITKFVTEYAFSVETTLDGSKIGCGGPSHLEI